MIIACKSYKGIYKEPDIKYGVFIISLVQFLNITFLYKKNHKTLIFLKIFFFNGKDYDYSPTLTSNLSPFLVGLHFSLNKRSRIVVNCIFENIIPKYSGCSIQVRLLPHIF